MGCGTLERLSVPASLLPEVMDSSAAFGMTDKDFWVQIPVAGMAGDQHCALFGQVVLTPAWKSTYGTAVSGVKTGSGP